MAERSIFWTTGSTGDGITPYTQLDWFQFVSRMFQTTPTILQVIPAFENELEPSVDGNEIVVATGGAIVAGIPYQNDTDVRLTPTPVVINTTGGIVVLRADYTAQTVRAVLKQSADGTITAPSVTQTLNTLWEVRIADYTITTAGVITITTDRREFLEYPSAAIYRRVGGDPDDWSVPFTGLGPLYRGKFYRIQCGSVRWTGAAATSGTLVVGLSSAGFLDKGIPIVTPKDANKVVSATMTAYDELEITWFAQDGVTTSTQVDFYFIIVGPGNA